MLLLRKSTFLCTCVKAGYSVSCLSASKERAKKHGSALELKAALKNKICQQAFSELYILRLLSLASVHSQHQTCLSCKIPHPLCNCTQSKASVRQWNIAQVDTPLSLVSPSVQLVSHSSWQNALVDAAATCFTEFSSRSMTGECRRAVPAFHQVYPW